jgi:hypothetical protein
MTAMGFVFWAASSFVTWAVYPITRAMSPRIAPQPASF